MFTDRNGQPCQASDDSYVAAMFRPMPKNLGETVMFTNEDEGFQEFYGRLLAYSSTKQSITMNESKKTTKKDDRMDVDAFGKGKVYRNRQEGERLLWQRKGQERPEQHEQCRVLGLRQDWSLCP